MHDLTITSIDTYECRIPLAKPFTLGIFHIAHRNYTVVRIRTAGGQEGTAYSLARKADLAETIKRNIETLWHSAWTFSDGGFTLPTAPSIGMDWNWEVVEHYQVTHHTITG